VNQIETIASDTVLIFAAQHPPDAGRRGRQLSGAHQHLRGGRLSTQPDLVVTSPIRPQPLCEYPEQQHRCSHPGYRFSQSREWFLRAEPYLVRLSEVLRLIPLTGAVAGLRGALDPASAEMTRLKAEIDLMGAAANLFPTGAGESGPTVGISDEVSGFRVVRGLLFDLDPAREFAGLRRVVSESGDYLWVCSDHYSIYDPGLPKLWPPSGIEPPVRRPPHRNRRSGCRRPRGPR
jgi:hypothetical protein